MLRTKSCTQLFIAILFIIQKKVETAQMSINWRMDKQNVVNPYNGMKNGESEYRKILSRSFAVKGIREMGQYQKWELQSKEGF